MEHVMCDSLAPWREPLTSSRLIRRATSRSLSSICPFSLSPSLTESDSLEVDTVNHKQEAHQNVASSITDRWTQSLTWHWARFFLRPFWTENSSCPPLALWAAAPAEPWGPSPAPGPEWPLPLGCAVPWTGSNKTPGQSGTPAPARSACPTSPCDWRGVDRETNVGALSSFTLFAQFCRI